MGQQNDRPSITPQHFPGVPRNAEEQLPPPQHDSLTVEGATMVGSSSYAEIGEHKMERSVRVPRSIQVRTYRLLQEARLVAPSVCSSGCSLVALLYALLAVPRVARLVARLVALLVALLHAFLALIALRLALLRALRLALSDCSSACSSSCYDPCSASCSSS